MRALRSVENGHGQCPLPRDHVPQRPVFSQKQSTTQGLFLSCISSTLHTLDFAFGSWFNYNVEGIQSSEEGRAGFDSEG